MSSERDLDKLTEELMAAAKTEQPSELVKERVLSSVLQEPGPSDSARATSRRMWWVGGLSLLAISVGLGVGSRRVLREEPQRPVTIVEVPPKPTEPIEAPKPQEAPAEVEALPPPPQPEPTLPPPKPAPPKKVKPTPTAPGPEPEEDVDLLAREVSLLDGVRAELTRAPKRALELLERHAREFPDGALKSEAELLRLEALVKAQRRAQAQQLAQRLSAQNPSGPVAERIQRILEGTSP